MPVTVAGIGDLTVDRLLLGVESLPNWGEESEVQLFEKRVGGNLGNVALATAHLGLDLRCVGPIGKDEDGDFLLGKLRQAGLDCSGVRQMDDAPTSTTIALVRRDGERLFLTVSGVLKHLDESLTNPTIAQAGIVFLTGWCQPPRIPAATLKQHMLIWREQGQRVVMDLAWADDSWNDPDAVLEIVQQLDLLLLNHHELGALTGQEGQVAGLQWMTSQLGPRTPTLVVKCGDNGAVAWSSSEGITKCGALTVQPRDTVGAGDFFNAAFLYARYEHEDSLDQALRFAAAFSGLALRDTRDHLPQEAHIRTAALELVG